MDATENVLYYFEALILMFNSQILDCDFKHLQTGFQITFTVFSHDLISEFL